MAQCEARVESPYIPPDDDYFASLPQQKDVTVYIALPGYQGAHPGSVRGVFRHATKLGAYVGEQYASLLSMNFNSHLCNALNLRKKFPIRYFAMLHSDIEPQEWWVDRLLYELERTKADIVSAVVPFKSPEGLTSMGIGDPQNPWSAYVRLTMKQVAKLPITFGAKDIGFPDWPLLVNSGCWITRLDHNWENFPGFTINDRITRRDDGSFGVDVESEDWYMSRWAWGRGMKVQATRAVKLTHHGSMGFPNFGLWGYLEEDDKPQGDIEPLRAALARLP